MTSRALFALSAFALSMAVPGTCHCSSSAFAYPDLLGANFSSLRAAPVRGFSVEATTPEGRLAPPGIDVCNVTLEYQHAGQDDRTRVQVFLPLAGWNGKFVGLGGGGFAAGNFDGEALVSTAGLGYSAAVTDAGHDTLSWSEAPWVLRSKGNLDYPLLVNFATRSVHEMTVVGKNLTAQFYGRPPRYAYFSGCSTGGRQGIVSAQSYPDDYDGILAGAPAVNLPDLTVSTYWPQSVMDRLGAYPSACELDGINQLSIEACDGLDGVHDGSLADPDACTFDPQTAVGRVVKCGDSTVRISADAANIVAAVRKGPTAADGRPLWHGTAHGTPFSGRLALGNTECDASHTNCTGQPFPMAVEWIKRFVQRDPDYDVGAMSLADLEAVYGRSRRELDGLIGGGDARLGGGGTNRNSFGAVAGRKMISWHGLADECITMRGTRAYYDAVLQADPDAGDYYRHFEAPGVHHCAAGPGAYYPLRALDALARWVEGGVAPDALVGYRMPDDNTTAIRPDPTSTRPLCRYPAVQTYGGGDPGEYGSFGCGEKKGTRTRNEL